MENNDQVQLIIPTSSQYEEVAQTTIAHLGLRSGFSLKEIENLREVMKATTDMFFSVREWEKPLHINFLFSWMRMSSSGFPWMKSRRTDDKIFKRGVIFKKIGFVIFNNLTVDIINFHKLFIKLT